MNRAVSRRTVLRATASFPAGLLLGGTGRAAASEPRIVALEWSLVSTLLTIGIVPVGIGETQGYRVWVSAPALPNSVVDVGLRNEPNLEALAALRPDLILVSPLSRSILPLIAPIAPAREIAFYTLERAPLRCAQRGLLALAAEFDRADAGARAVAQADATFAAARIVLRPRAERPVLVVSFLDARHVRVFGPGSLFDDVLGRVGLANAWSRPGDVWGVELVGIDQLARYPNARIVVVEPVPPDVLLEPETTSTLWGNLPSVRAGRVTRLPPAWQFGDLAAGALFAQNLAEVIGLAKGGREPG